MPARELPHYWTPEQVRQILVALPAGQPWLFALLLWRAARLRSAGLYVTHVVRTWATPDLAASGSVRRAIIGFIARLLPAPANTRRPYRELGKRPQAMCVTWGNLCLPPAH